MYKYKSLLVMGILCVVFVGCGNSDTNKEEIPVGESTSTLEDEVKIDIEEDINAQEQEGEELVESDITHNSVVEHDDGYVDLIHGGFVQMFQQLMEEIYSRVNYNLVGIAVEEITPMDESLMTSVEEMMQSLNPVQDGEIMGIVKKTRGLFDRVSEIIEEKKYEKLGNLDEEGQILYNEYYEWLIKTAESHTHEEEE